MVELLFQICLPKQIMLVKTDVVDVQKKVKQGPKKSRAPLKPILLAKNKLEGVDLRREMQRLRNSHLYMDLHGDERKWIKEKGWGG